MAYLNKKIEHVIVVRGCILFILEIESLYGRGDGVRGRCFALLEGHDRTPDSVGESVGGDCERTCK